MIRFTDEQSRCLLRFLQIKLWHNHRTVINIDDVRIDPNHKITINLEALRKSPHSGSHDKI
jgi:hypothetical protein